MPGSGVPKPVSAAVTMPASVTTVSVPLREPCAVGAKTTLMVQALVVAMD
jgi:hypothetical protein